MMRFDIGEELCMSRISNVMMLTTDDSKKLCKIFDLDKEDSPDMIILLKQVKS